MHAIQLNVLLLLFICAAFGFRRDCKSHSGIGLRNHPYSPLNSSFTDAFSLSLSSMVLVNFEILLLLLCIAFISVLWQITVLGFIWFFRKIQWLRRQRRLCYLCRSIVVWHFGKNWIIVLRYRTVCNYLLVVVNIYAHFSYCCCCFCFFFGFTLLDAYTHP